MTTESGQCLIFYEVHRNGKLSCLGKDRESGVIFGDKVLLSAPVTAR